VSQFEIWPFPRHFEAPLGTVAIQESGSAPCGPGSPRFARDDGQAFKLRHYLEVKSFDFSITVKLEDKEVSSLSKKAASSSGGRKLAEPDTFERWRSVEGNEWRGMHFPVEFDKFSFTRLLDAASMPFFTACCNSVSFYSASLVKRVSVGIAGSDQKKPMDFLRFDFRDVLLIDVCWSDGEPRDRELQVHLPGHAGQV